MIYPLGTSELRLDIQELTPKEKLVFDIVGICATFIGLYALASNINSDVLQSQLKKSNVNIYPYGEFNEGMDLLVDESGYFLLLDYIPGSLLTILAKKGEWCVTPNNKRLFKASEEFTMTFSIADNGLDLSGGTYETPQGYTTYDSVERLDPNATNLLEQYVAKVGARVTTFGEDLQLK